MSYFIVGCEDRSYLFTCLLSISFLITMECFAKRVNIHRNENEPSGEINGFSYTFYPFLMTLHRAFFIQTLILETSTLSFNTPGTMLADSEPTGNGAPSYFSFFKPGCGWGHRRGGRHCFWELLKPSAQKWKPETLTKHFPQKHTHSLGVTSLTWGECRCEHQPHFSAHLHPASTSTLG